jgi:hypothetical protein
MAARRKGGDPRTPRARNADVIDRHHVPGLPHTSHADANMSARTTMDGFPDTRMLDPDNPTADEPRGQALSRLAEGHTPTPGAGQGIGAGRRRRHSKHRHDEE